MKYRSTGIVILVATMAIGLSGWIASAQEKDDAKQAATAKPFKPVQPIGVLMDGQKKLFGEIREGIVDEKWDDAATSAWILAEMANVNHYVRDVPQYQQFADQLSDTASTLAKALKKKDGAQAKQMVGEIGKTCKACHDQYKKD